jgi:hypothetical protein
VNEHLPDRGEQVNTDLPRAARLLKTLDGKQKSRHRSA